MIYNTRLHKASKIVKNYSKPSGARYINHDTRDIIHTCLHTMADSDCLVLASFNLNNSVINNES